MAKPVTRVPHFRPAPLTTTVVGSMPRPAFVRDAMERKVAGESVDWAIDAAVQYVIALQEAAGVDIVSDGEWRRLSYIGIVADICSGFVREERDGGIRHTVVEPIQMTRPGLIAEEARYLVESTRGGAKIALPSPYLLGELMWDPVRSREAYSSKRAFTESLVPVLRAELEALEGIGLAYVQFDDPHICLFVDSDVRARYQKPDEELAYACDLLRRVVAPDAVRGRKLPLALHLCRSSWGHTGSGGKGGYKPIIPHLRQLPLDLYLLEFALPDAGDIEVLKEIPDDRRIGLGCVDCRVGVVDSPEAISARVKRAMRFVPPERLLLNPDCGFAPDSPTKVPLDEAYLKLRNQVRAARSLREELGLEGA